MKGRTGTAIAAWLLAMSGAALAPASRAEADSGVIRLQMPDEPAPPESEATTVSDPKSGARHSFNVEAFDGRFESLWFQRKAYLAEGRDDDAARQSDRIRDFVSEEGIRRLEIPAGALLMEARAWQREGSYEKALAALSLAESLDPDRPQIAMARAHVHWTGDGGALAAAAEWLAAIRGTVAATVKDLNTAHGVAVVAVMVAMAMLGVFAVFMMLRYQLVLRHDIEEWLVRERRETWAKAAGYSVLLAPFVLWFAAGWFALYWLALFFRYMRRTERLVTVGLLLACAAAVPAYRFSVGLYGLAADPTVRTTLAAANGGYDPDRIVKMRALVDAHEDDPMYRFLLAGLYKNGRYYEDAFKEYRRVLEMAPATYQARINLGNIFFVLGQYGEAISNYRKAIDIRPDSALAYYDMYLAQSDSFKLKEATESLAKARDLDPAETNVLLSSGGRDGTNPKVVDAVIDFSSIWKASVEGRRLREWLDAPEDSSGWAEVYAALASLMSVLAFATLIACGATLAVFRGRQTAQRCLRCGMAFCPDCKSGRDGYEYCSQCVHLFVLGDGLAPETKSMKLYEVERFEVRGRRVRRILALVLPGASHLLSGRAWVGCLLAACWMLAWIAAYPQAVAPVERALGIGLHVAGLRPGVSPAVYDVNALILLAVPLGIVAWLAGNLGQRRLRGA